MYATLRARSAAVRTAVKEAVAEIEEEKAAIQTRLRTADVLVAEGDNDEGDTSLEALSPDARHKLLDELDDLDDAAIERSIAEINEAIRRSAARTKS